MSKLAGLFLERTLVHGTLDDIKPCRKLRVIDLSHNHEVRGGCEAIKVRTT